jgi:CopG family nickel-responsive transcriptional regulator
MSEIRRFTVSLPGELLDEFDQQIEEQGYPTRSKAVADLIRSSLVDQQWQQGDEVAAAIILVFDHHHSGLGTKLTHIQHDYHHLVISSQHIHLDHDNCLEIIAVRGEPARIQELYGRLRGTKGVKYGSLAAAATGRGL